MTLPDYINQSEILGRRVFHSRDARRAANGVYSQRLLQPRRGENLSVDRLDGAELADLAAIARQQDGRILQGWIAITAQDAADCGHPAAAAPTAENPRHAELLFANWEQDHITESAVQSAPQRSLDTGPGNSMNYMA